jgi:hypothetical protein
MRKCVARTAGMIRNTSGTTSAISYYRQDGRFSNQVPAAIAQRHADRAMLNLMLDSILTGAPTCFVLS